MEQFVAYSRISEDRFTQVGDNLSLVSRELRFATLSGKMDFMVDTENGFTPGHGPAAKVSVSLRSGNIRAIKERVGARGFSAYVDAAVERQIERDLLEEALLANEEKVGPLPRHLREEAEALFREVKSSPELQEEVEWPAHQAS